MLRICWLAALAISAANVAELHAQIRVVSYNTLDRPSQAGDFTPWEVVLEAIGDQSVAGITQRVGVMALQEVSVTGESAENIAELLNNLYGVSTYHAASAPYGDGFNLQSFVYDAGQVTLLDSVVFPMGTRPGWRGQFRPVGYDSPSADLFVYSVHLKAFPGFETQRGGEALTLRNNGNALGQGANIIYAGDFNLTSGAAEPAYANMLAPGNGQAVDPQSGDFSDPLKKSYSSSGANSRIDFQFVSGELLDREGVDLIDGSYRVFGREKVGSRLITTPTELISASDHLPVVADYQLPAMLEAIASQIPTTLQLGEEYALNITVSNGAPVVAVNGADELDYALSATGDIGSLLGARNGVDSALGGGNLHQLALDTSSLGAKSGSIVISSDSLGVARGMIQLDISYEVLAPSDPADLNHDGKVDIFDVAIISAHWGEGGPEGDANADNTVDIFDVALVSNNWRPDGARNVPEPDGATSAIILALAAPAFAVFSSHKTAKAR